MFGQLGSQMFDWWEAWMKREVETKQGKVRRRAKTNRAEAEFRLAAREFLTAGEFIQFEGRTYYRRHIERQTFPPYYE